VAGSTLDFEDISQPDRLGCEIARTHQSWFMFLVEQRKIWKEIHTYLFATDTRHTTNNLNPWRNSTTIPKMCQVRDNLFSNYMAVMYPKRQWLDWLANNKSDASVEKRDSILNYMRWTVTQPHFKPEMAKCVQDFIDTGNAFAMPRWMDLRQMLNSEVKSGFVGPAPMRIAPDDITFNPIASSFQASPKIIRSLITFGELKKLLSQMSKDENHQEYEDLFKYLMNYRHNIRQSGADLTFKSDYYQVDGFGSFQQYLEGDYVEILTFYGDIYDVENDELLENHVIMVADRHKVIAKKPNPSSFGYAPIFHVAWRTRPGILWGMSPLANLIGMQYRLDHVENMKADILDALAFPVIKIKGYVNDFEWKPMARITMDTDSDVELLQPPYQALQMNNELQLYSSLMEEMAGSPKEAMGFRTPGEKTAFEVQRLENAASRIFQNKIAQFEEQLVEPLLNSMLEMARRQIDGVQEINVFDDEFRIQTFMELTADDITGAGRLKPIASRHFAEKAELVQNLTQLYQTLMQADPDLKAHFSSIQLAKMLEHALDLEDFGIVQPNIRVSEAQDTQRLAAAGQEQLGEEIMTPTGFTPDDSDQPFELPEA
jgi:hypothetical protein